MTEHQPQAFQAAFLQSLPAVAGLVENNSPQAVAACNRAFREALPAYAGFGADNLACVDEISIGKTVDKTADGTLAHGTCWALRLTNADNLTLPTLLWTAEGCPSRNQSARPFPP